MIYHRLMDVRTDVQMDIHGITNKWTDPNCIAIKNMVPAGYPVLAISWISDKSNPIM